MKQKTAFKATVISKRAVSGQVQTFFEIRGDDDKIIGSMALTINEAMYPILQNFDLILEKREF